VLPNTLAGVLASAAAPAIANVLAHGGGCSARPSGEVSAVRAMTLDGFDAIATAWSPILKNLGYRIDLRAVFCHSRPQVTFPRFLPPRTPLPIPSRGRCELADLLVVIDHVDPAKMINDRRAVLIQAKLLKGGQIKPSGNEWIQHELLARRPPFTFVESDYTPHARDLNGTPLVGAPDKTAEYGGINLSAAPAKWNQWIPVTTSPYFHKVITLSQYLASMAVGHHTCSRKALRGGKDAWSYTVDELLKVTAAKPIVKSSMAVLRGNDNIIGFLADTVPHFGIGGSGGTGGKMPEEKASEWPDGPISTVHMTFGPLD
jgi:hypothetical protein